MSPRKQYNIKCKLSDATCVYHACMSDHCQKRFAYPYLKVKGNCHGMIRKPKSKAI